MSSIGSIGSSASMMQGMSRPSPAQMADKVFSSLDTEGAGYIGVDALQSVADGSDSSLDVEGLFSQLDSDSDGKVTKDEFSTAFNKVAEQLNSQFDSMRMQDAMGGMAGMGGMPPPPPPPGEMENDTGFTQEELTAQLEEIGDTDSARSALISSVLDNFDTADADGDGRVTFEEAMSLQQDASSSAATTTANSTGSATGAADDEDMSTQVVMQTLKLMQTYMLNDGEQQSATNSLSVSA